jgi:hypothetical protein
VKRAGRELVGAVQGDANGTGQFMSSSNPTLPVAVLIPNLANDSQIAPSIPKHEIPISRCSFDVFLMAEVHRKL